jgi:hypothetical protein
LPKFDVTVEWNETWMGHVVVEADSLKEARGYLISRVDDIEMINIAQDNGGLVKTDECFDGVGIGAGIEIEQDEGTDLVAEV